MDGPSHYKTAEALLRNCSEPGISYEVTRAVVAMAQVHALLALTAATIRAGGLHGVTTVDLEVEWPTAVGSAVTR